MPASDALALRDPFEAVMREAGDLARVTASRQFKHWTKGPQNSPVSEGDLAVNELLKDRLPKLAPDAGWLSEETEDEAAARSARRVWIVDPIDGTRAYIAGLSDWTVSVALVEDGLPVLAGLYAPVTEEMFLAVRGQGATLNGSLIRSIDDASLTGARVAGPKRYLDQLSQLTPTVLPQPRVNSLALRLTRVAHGALDAAFASGGSHDWDLAAADLLVHEAGGVLTDFVGRPLSYNRPHIVHTALIAAGPARHGTLIDLVRDRQAEFA